MPAHNGPSDAVHGGSAWAAEAGGACACACGGPSSSAGMLSTADAACPALRLTIQVNHHRAALGCAEAQRRCGEVAREGARAGQQGAWALDVTGAHPLGGEWDKAADVCNSKAEGEPCVQRARRVGSVGARTLLQRAAPSLKPCRPCRQLHQARQPLHQPAPDARRAPLATTCG